MDIAATAEGRLSDDSDRVDNPDGERTASQTASSVMNTVNGTTATPSDDHNFQKAISAWRSRASISIDFVNDKANIHATRYRPQQTCARAR